MAIKKKIKKAVEADLDLDLLEEDVELEEDGEVEDEFEEEFEKLFPSEEIIFISEGSLTEIKNPEHEIGYGLVSLDVELDDNFEPIFITSGYNLTCVEVAENNYALAA